MALDRNGFAAAALAAGVCILANAADKEPASLPTGLEGHEMTPVMPAQAAPADLRFVVLGDRTGYRRPGVFERAIEHASSLSPDLVVNVGDLVEGYTDRAESIETQWREVLDIASRLPVPLVLVPGNHDLSNPAMQQYWNRRFGDSYGAFRYREVLFLKLDTEDPPPPIPQAQVDALKALRDRATALAARDPQAAAPLFERFRTGIAPLAISSISEHQLRYFARVLDRNRDVRWTFVLMHKPAWIGTYTHERFARIEALLADRPYTVLAGHRHVYAHERRHGRDYLSLGTVGGDLHHPDSPDTMDHLLLVSMAPDGPRYANLLLTGFVPLQGRSALSPAARAAQTPAVLQPSPDPTPMP